MIRHLVLALTLFLALAAPGNSARADCALPSLGETRPAGALVLNSLHNVVQYCDGTVWKALIWNAMGGGGGGACFETWTARESDRTWSSIASSADGTKLVANVFDGRIYTSTDSGATWTQRDSADRPWVSIASSADGTKLVATASHQDEAITDRIYTSADSGATWTPRDSNRYWGAVASSSDGVKLAALAANIYTSTDSGVNWTARVGGLQWTGLASSADGAILAATVWNGQIRVSTDSGVNWTPRASSRAWTDIAMSADGSVMVATAGDFDASAADQIYMSTDTGVTWAPLSSSSFALWQKIALSADGVRIAATIFGVNTVIFTSDDSGATWHAQTTVQNWGDIASSADGTKLAALAAGGPWTPPGQIFTSECTGGSGIATPTCTDDAAETCLLSFDRDSGDPEFTAANIADGVNILGVTGTLTAGGCTGGASCPDAGDVCSDGTIFAGCGGSSGDPFFVARCDAGQTWNGSACTGTRSTHYWADENDSSNLREVDVVDELDGQANTLALTQAPGGGACQANQPCDSKGWSGVQAHNAAQYCANLDLHGHQDWYLPAYGELLAALQFAGGFSTTYGDTYQTSTESTTDQARVHVIDEGFPYGFDFGKEWDYFVRCARHN